MAAAVAAVAVVAVVNGSSSRMPGLDWPLPLGRLRLGASGRGDMFGATGHILRSSLSHSTGTRYAVTGGYGRELGGPESQFVNVVGTTVSHNTLLSSCQLPSSELCLAPGPWDCCYPGCQVWAYQATPSSALDPAAWTDWDGPDAGEPTDGSATYVR